MKTNMKVEKVLISKNGSDLVMVSVKDFTPLFPYCQDTCEFSINCANGTGLEWASKNFKIDKDKIKKVYIS